MSKEKEIGELLKRDGLHEAEILTGKSYKEDKITEHIGFMNHIQIANKKEELLSSVDDTVSSETESEYLRKVTDFGFKSLMIEPFVNEGSIEERLHIMFHYDYSILLVWDTHTWGDDGSWAKAGKPVPQPSCNSGSFYYNWIPNDIKDRHSYTSSGGMISNGGKTKNYTILFNKDLTPHPLPEYLVKSEPRWVDNQSFEDFSKINDVWSKNVNDYLKDKNISYIWSGYHDCREALKFKITQMAENGTFLKEWKKQPFLWLLNYMDTKTDNYKDINIERINNLPKDIQKIIKGK